MRNATRAVVLSAVVALSLPLATFAKDKDSEKVGGLRYTVTVTKFENKAGWYGTWDVGDAWGTVLTDLLTNSGKFIVLGESDMRNAAMDEQDLTTSGRTAGGAKAPVTGQMTPAQILVKGAITHIQHDTKEGGGGIRVKGIGLGGGAKESEINLTIYMVDSTTGQVIASKSVIGKAKGKRAGISYSSSDFGAAFGGKKDDNLGKAVTDAAGQAVDWLIGELPGMPWSGSVVMVKGDKVYVNRGEREGVAVGQQFVVGDREVIRDPDTGEVLDESVKEVARLQVSEVKDKLSICSVTSGSAKAIQKGHAIQLP